MFNKVKKFELRRRICVVVATECLERMDILNGQNTESVITFTFNKNESNIIAYKYINN